MDPALETIINSLGGRGIRLYPAGDKLAVEPADRLTDQDRVLLRKHRDSLLALLSAPENREPATAPAIGESIPPLPIDLSRIADAIARNPRSPFLNDLALVVFVRGAIGAARAIADLPEAARPAARLRCLGLQHRIVAAITGADYAAAYALADALIRLPDELAELAPQ
jgi:hypothetical protein